MFCSLILNADEMRKWDAYTITHEPLSSLQLMERAATACTTWLMNKGFTQSPLAIFCGRGNNGGDGLAIARQLSMSVPQIDVYLPDAGHPGSDDFQANLAALHQFPLVRIHEIVDKGEFPELSEHVVIIDALWGTGINRPLDGLNAELVQYLNQHHQPVISIDLPSGMPADRSSVGYDIVRASHTLSFQCAKTAFLVSENAQFIGELHLLDIGLHSDFPGIAFARNRWITPALLKTFLKKRNEFSHKGNFGHALLVAGSYGKMGAAVLAAEACMRSGAGLLTCHIPQCGYSVMQTAVPEAMVQADFNKNFISSIDVSNGFAACGLGPGIGRARETALALDAFTQQYSGVMVWDADALNLLATSNKWLLRMKENTILTPHPGEFRRLAGNWIDEFEMIEKAREYAMLNGLVLVLKGHYTMVAMPDGKAWFNSTGNPGMATAGSGDVLTGLITGLLAQGYGIEKSALLGVYLHGLAGDIAVADGSQEALIASDITANLGHAFHHLRQFDDAELNTGFS